MQPPSIAGLKQCMAEGVHRPVSRAVLHANMLRETFIPFVGPVQQYQGKRIQPVVHACSRCGLVYWEPRLV